MAITSHEQYENDVLKKLEKFKNAKEWSDFLEPLDSLCSVFKNQKSGNIPCIPQLVKRLNQLLNPSLPGGIHMKTIECYHAIFDHIDFENLERDFDALTIGLFTFSLHCRILVAGDYLNLMEKIILKLGPRVERFSKNVILGVLPFLELESSEFYNRAYLLLISFLNQISQKTFYSALWRNFIDYSDLRLCVINFMNNYKLVVITDYRLVTNALCAGLKSGNFYIIRSILEIVNRDFPYVVEFTSDVEVADETDAVSSKSADVLSPGRNSPDQLKLINQKIKNLVIESTPEENEKCNSNLIHYILKIFLIKEMGITKRAYKWLNLGDQILDQDVDYLEKGLRTYLNGDETYLLVFFKIVNALADKENLIGFLIDRLAIDALRSTMAVSNKNNLDTFINLQNSVKGFLNLSLDDFYRMMYTKLSACFEKAPDIDSIFEEPTTEHQEITSSHESLSIRTTESSIGFVDELLRILIYSIEKHDAINTNATTIHLPLLCRLLIKNKKKITYKLFSGFIDIYIKYTEITNIYEAREIPDDLVNTFYQRINCKELLELSLTGAVNIEISKINIYKETKGDSIYWSKSNLIEQNGILIWTQPNDIVYFTRNAGGFFNFDERDVCILQLIIDTFGFKDFNQDFLKIFGRYLTFNYKFKKLIKKLMFFIEKELLYVNLWNDFVISKNPSFLLHFSEEGLLPVINAAFPMITLNDICNFLSKSLVIGKYIEILFRVATVVDSTSSPFICLILNLTDVMPLLKYIFHKFYTEDHNPYDFHSISAILFILQTLIDSSAFERVFLNNQKVIIGQFGEIDVMEAISRMILQIITNEKDYYNPDITSSTLFNQSSVYNHMIGRRLKKYSAILNLNDHLINKEVKEKMVRAQNKTDLQITANEDMQIVDNNEDVQIVDNSKDMQITANKDMQITDNKTNLQITDNKDSQITHDNKDSQITHDNKDVQITHDNKTDFIKEITLPGNNVISSHTADSQKSNDITIKSKENGNINYKGMENVSIGDDLISKKAQNQIKSLSLEPKNENILDVKKCFILFENHPIVDYNTEVLDSFCLMKTNSTFLHQETLRKLGFDCLYKMNKKNIPVIISNLTEIKKIICEHKNDFYLLKRCIFLVENDFDFLYDNFMHFYKLILAEISKMPFKINFFTYLADSKTVCSVEIFLEAMQYFTKIPSFKMNDLYIKAQRLLTERSMKSTVIYKRSKGQYKQVSYKKITDNLNLNLAQSTLKRIYSEDEIAEVINGDGSSTVINGIGSSTVINGDRSSTVMGVIDSNRPAIAIAMDNNCQFSLPQLVVLTIDDLQPILQLAEVLYKTNQMLFISSIFQHKESLYFFSILPFKIDIFKRLLISYKNLKFPLEILRFFLQNIPYDLRTDFLKSEAEFIKNNFSIGELDYEAQRFILELFTNQSPSDLSKLIFLHILNNYESKIDQNVKSSFNFDNEILILKKLIKFNLKDISILNSYRNCCFNLLNSRIYRESALKIIYCYFLKYPNCKVFIDQISLYFNKNFFTFGMALKKKILEIVINSSFFDPFLAIENAFSGMDTSFFMSAQSEELLKIYSLKKMGFLILSQPMNKYSTFTDNFVYLINSLINSSSDIKFEVIRLCSILMFKVDNNFLLTLYPILVAEFMVSMQSKDIRVLGEIFKFIDLSIWLNSSVFNFKTLFLEDHHFRNLLKNQLFTAPFEDCVLEIDKNTLKLPSFVFKTFKKFTEWKDFSYFINKISEYYSYKEDNMIKNDYETVERCLVESFEDVK